MKLTFDTNILVRAAMQDDGAQARAAAKLFREAELIILPTSCLCEFAWVLRRTYKLDRQSIVSALQQLFAIQSLRTNMGAAEAGLELLQNGGDFADGVIAYEGSQLGAEAFVSFDRSAVRLAKQQGLNAFVPNT